MIIIMPSRKQEKTFPYESLISMKNTNVKLEYIDDIEYKSKELNYKGIDMIIRWFNVKDHMSYQSDSLPQEWNYKITFNFDSADEEILWITKDKIIINDDIFIYSGNKEYMKNLLEVLEFVYNDDRFGIIVY